MRLSAAALILGALMLSGCARQPLLRPAGVVAPLELAATPFFPQDAYQCGPAALATVLAATGVTVTPAALVPEVYVPARRGSLQPELVAAARRRGRQPVPLPAELSGLRSALAFQAPVLVLLNQGLGIWPVWHYAVVVGLDPVTDAVVLRSAETRRAVVPAERFLRQWRAAGAWGVTLHAADAPPPWAELADWLDTVSVWARTGQTSRALTATATAVRRWPRAASAWLAHGNALYARARPGAAATAFERALALQPTAGGYNNLAHVLTELGCRDAALAAVSTARSRYGEHPLLAQTASAAAALPADNCAR